MSDRARRRLIVTADDFGAATAVNEAVEEGHADGILTAASLMVTGAAVGDAIARARRLPRLGVGLHLTLVEGRPVLSPDRIPALVDGDGAFRANMTRAGIAIFCRPAARRQLAAEIEAQFAAFAATGLPLDHVNAHKHFHLHPTIASLVMRIGARFGLRGVRAPFEPAAVLTEIEPVKRNLADRIAAPWARRLRTKLASCGFTVPDQVFGLAWSGRMSSDRLAGLIRHLPEGLSEIYLHPATHDRFPSHAPGYRSRDELAALLDPRAREAVDAGRVRLGCFADFAAATLEAPC